MLIVNIKKNSHRQLHTYDLTNSEQKETLIKLLCIVNLRDCVWQQKYVLW